MHKDMTLKDVLIRFKPFYKKYKKEFAIAIFGMILTSMFVNTPHLECGVLLKSLHSKQSSI